MIYYRLQNYVIKAAVDKSGGIMVALGVPADVQKKLALEGGQPAESLHCTLVYLGKEEDFPAEKRQTLHDIVASIARESKPIDLNILGYGVFPETDDGPCLHAVVELTPELDSLHETVVEAVSSYGMPPQGRGAVEYRPHITLAYGESAPPPLDPPVATFKAEWLIANFGETDGEFRMIAKAEWDESEHPRDSEGRFASTGAAAVASAEKEVGDMADKMVAAGVPGPTTTVERWDEMEPAQQEASFKYFAHHREQDFRDAVANRYGKEIRAKYQDELNEEDNKKTLRYLLEQKLKSSGWKNMTPEAAKEIANGADIYLHEKGSAQDARLEDLDLKKHGVDPGNMVNVLNMRDAFKADQRSMWRMEVEHRMKQIPKAEFDAQVKEAIAEKWDNYSEGTKFGYAEQAGENRVAGKLEPPKEFKLLKNGVNYAKTRDFAQTLAMHRAAMLDAGAKSWDEHDTPYWKELTDKYERHSNDLWAHWKGDSQSYSGLMMQLAAHDELGAEVGPHFSEKLRGAIPMALQGNNMTTAERDKQVLAFDAMDDHEQANWMRKDPKYKMTKNYIRGLWETNQYIAKKAGYDKMIVYRGLMLPTSEVNREKDNMVEEYAGIDQQGRPAGLRELYMPGLSVKKNGAMSFTAVPEVANTWEGIASHMPEHGATRIVIKAEVPASAVLSFPVYGKNYHEEQEVVILGTKFDWKAYFNHAPAGAMKQAWSGKDPIEHDLEDKQDIRRREPLVISLDADRMNWLWKPGVMKDGESGSGMMAPSESGGTPLFSLNQDRRRKPIDGQPYTAFTPDGSLGTSTSPGIMKDGFGGGQGQGQGLAVALAPEYTKPKKKAEGDFDESKHPRAEDGKFTAGAGVAPGGGGEDTLPVDRVIMPREQNQHGIAAAQGWKFEKIDGKDEAMVYSNPLRPGDELRISEGGWTYYGADGSSRGGSESLDLDKHLRGLNLRAERVDQATHPDAPPSTWTTESATNWGRKLVQEEAFGLDADQASHVFVRAGDGPKFKVGDRSYSEGGHFDPSNGAIVMFLDSETKANLEGMIAHEVQHKKFHVAWPEIQRQIRQVGDEWQALKDKVGSAAADKEVYVNGVNSDILTPKYAARFPALAAYREAMEMERGGLKGTKLLALDGKLTTPYAEAYWEAWEKSDGSIGTDRAVNETLAECARLRYQNKRLPKSWQAMWNAFDLAYKSAKGMMG